MAVTGIKRLDYTADTYDLTVADNHNYFVGIAGNSVLVHNCLEVVTESIIGPVTSEVNPPQITPKVFIHDTKAVPTRPYKIWHYAMAFLAKHKKRHEMIVNQALADVKAGHHIIIPVAYVNQAKSLADDIEKALRKKYGKAGLAVAFHSKVLDRDKILENAKSGRVKVVVGIRSLVQAGINIPRWSAIYEVAPISNLPNHTQEIARVRTPMDGKLQPIIRHFVDPEMGMCLGCFKTCFQVYKHFEWDEKSKELAIHFLRKSKPTKMSSEMDEGYYQPVRSEGSGFSKVKTSYESRKNNNYGIFK